MKIIVARPPNFAAIAAALPMADKPGVIFCFGDSIYNPAGGPISPWIMTHERVHSKQQAPIRSPGGIAISPMSSSGSPRSSKPIARSGARGSRLPRAIEPSAAATW